MEITKFAGKSCIKCKMLDRIFKQVELPCEIKTRYVEDESNEQFLQEGVDSLPTLVFKNSTDTIRLSGTITPKQIKEVIEQLKD